MNWISVNDQLPPIAKIILFFSYTKQIGVGAYIPHETRTDWSRKDYLWISSLDGVRIDVASHWIIVPEPPVKEQVMLQEERGCGDIPRCQPNQPECSKREDLTSISPLPEGLAKRVWEMSQR